MCHHQLMVYMKWCPISLVKISTLNPCSSVLRGHYLVEGAPKVGVGPREANWDWVLISVWDIQRPRTQQDQSVRPPLWSNLKYLRCEWVPWTSIIPRIPTVPRGFALLTFPPAWGWHVWFWVKCLTSYRTDCHNISHLQLWFMIKNACKTSHRLSPELHSSMLVMMNTHVNIVSVSI